MNKKVYLLLPYIAGEEATSNEVMNIIDGEHVPLGIYYIASYLRENGYEVAVTDALAMKLTEEQIAAEIAAFAPAFVGISATTIALPKAVSAARMIKNKFPDIVTILGGRHLSSNRDHAMSYRDFDYGVIGEGEITALELLDALTSGQSVTGINGVAYRDEKGEPVYNPDRALIENLDILPFPAFDLIPDIDIYKPPLFMHKARPLLSMITSRGCPSKCTFCAVSLGKAYRKRSAQNIFNEIKQMIDKFGIKEIDFLDDNFLLDKKRIYELFELMRSEGVNIHWSCMARISSVDYEFLKFLRDHGCWNIAFGIESGDKTILKTIKKGLSLEKAGTVLAWCQELGIMTRGFFIIGHPLETVETIDRTIDYALSIPLDLIMVSINTPFPGTQQYDEAEKYGTLDKTDLTRFSQDNPVFVPYGLTKEILVQKRTEMERRFFFRPKIIFRLINIYFGKHGTARLERAKTLFTIMMMQLRGAATSIAGSNQEC